MKRDDVDLFLSCCGELAIAQCGILVGEAVKTVASNMVLGRKLVRDGISRRVFRQGAMKCGVEGGNHRKRSAQKCAGGANAADARGVMQRSDLTQRVEGVDNTLINQNRGRESIATVNHPMSHGVEYPECLLRAQPINDPAYCFFMITKGSRFLLVRNASGFKPKRGSIAYSINNAPCQFFGFVAGT